MVKRVSVSPCTSMVGGKRFTFGLEKNSYWAHPWIMRAVLDHVGASRDEADQVGGSPAVPLGRVDLDRAAAAAEAESRVGKHQVAVASKDISLGSLVILAAAEAVGGQDCRDGR